jgi:aryl-alcohol dehydrogenase-like predicted oxidoreductase
MYHDFADYRSGRIIDELVELKNSHLIQKIGVSLYSLEQLKLVVEDSSIDLIQLPANLFDLSTDKLELLRLARSAGKEVHARSVFLQGLFLRDPEMLTGNLVSFRPYLKQLRILSNELNVDLKQYALNFVLHQPYIDCIILGVERAEQLQENLTLMIDSFDLSKCPKIEIEECDMYLLNPSNWRL